MTTGVRSGANSEQESAMEEDWPFVQEPSTFDALGDSVYAQPTPVCLGGCDFRLDRNEFTCVTCGVVRIAAPGTGTSGADIATRDVVRRHERAAECRALTMWRNKYSVPGGSCRVCEQEFARLSSPRAKQEREDMKSAILQKQRQLKALRNLATKTMEHVNNGAFDTPQFPDISRRMWREALASRPLNPQERIQELLNNTLNCTKKQLKRKFTKLANETSKQCTDALWKIESELAALPDPDRFQVNQGTHMQTIAEAVLEELVKTKGFDAASALFEPFMQPEPPSVDEQAAAIARMELQELTVQRLRTQNRQCCDTDSCKAKMRIGLHGLAFASRKKVDGKWITTTNDDSESVGTLWKVQMPMLAVLCSERNAAAIEECIQQLFHYSAFYRIRSIQTVSSILALVRKGEETFQDTENVLYDLSMQSEMAATSFYTAFFWPCSLHHDQIGFLSCVKRYHAKFEQSKGSAGVDAVLLVRIAQFDEVARSRPDYATITRTVPDGNTYKLPYLHAACFGAQRNLEVYATTVATSFQEAQTARVMDSSQEDRLVCETRELKCGFHAMLERVRHGRHIPFEIVEYEQKVSPQPINMMHTNFLPRIEAAARRFSTIKPNWLKDSWQDLGITTPEDVHPAKLLFVAADGTHYDVPLPMPVRLTNSRRQPDGIQVPVRDHDANLANKLFKLELNLMALASGSQSNEPCLIGHQTHPQPPGVEDDAVKASFGDCRPKLDRLLECAPFLRAFAANLQMRREDAHEELPSEHPRRKMLLSQKMSELVQATTELVQAISDAAISDAKSFPTLFNLTIDLMKRRAAFGNVRIKACEQSPSLVTFRLPFANDSGWTFLEQVYFCFLKHKKRLQRLRDNPRVVMRVASQATVTATTQERRHQMAMEFMEPSKTNAITAAELRRCHQSTCATYETLGSVTGVLAFLLGLTKHPAYSRSNAEFYSAARIYQEVYKAFLQTRRDLTAEEVDKCKNAVSEITLAMVHVHQLQIDYWAQRKLFARRESVVFLVSCASVHGTNLERNHAESIIQAGMDFETQKTRDYTMHRMLKNAPAFAVEYTFSDGFERYEELVNAQQARFARTKTPKTVNERKGMELEQEETELQLFGK